MTQPTRNHLEILIEINKLLKTEGLESDRLLLEKTIKSSSTGTEICLRVGSTLLTLKKNKAINLAIGKQIDEFVTYCNSNGLFPESSKTKK
jgi:hypothetical protein